MARPIKPESVKFVKILATKNPNPKLPDIPLVDKEGSWIQVKIMSGPRKGCFKPDVLE